MKNNDLYDLCVIGAGSGGLSVAAAAASFGQKVVLVEKGKMGGDCLNYGCVPSKALIAAAKQAYGFTTGEPFGIRPQKPQVDFSRVNEHVHSVIAGIAPHDSQARFESLGVKVVRAAARFIDSKTIMAGDETCHARRFVIATGSSPAAPPVPGLADVDYLTNETIFLNKTLPEHLIIIGGGPIGMEMAQAHSRLGAQVTVLEAFSPLGKDDPELSRFVLDQLAKEGIEVMAGAKITNIGQSDDGINIKLEHEAAKLELNGSHLLVAAGRKPNIEGLGLEAAGIEYDRPGIRVDKGLRTTNSRVYAIGDVAGGLQFTHVAGYQAGLVVRNILFRLPVTNRTSHIPWVTYTDPELANVGLTEAGAKQSGIKIKVLRWSFAENDRARAERKTDGMIKAIISKRGKILGCGIVGPGAGELIQSWSLAVSSGLKISDMMNHVVAYPTISEISRRVAITHYAEFPANPWVRRVIGWLKIFG